jgi:hypothetical protein
MEPMLRYPDPGLLDFTSTMRAKTGKTGVPYRIGECNSFAGGGATGVSNSCASSLWAIEMMMGSAIGGACGLNFHVNYSSRGYSPIPFNATDASGVQPEYYGMLMASMAGTGQLKSTTISDHKLNCSAFAIKDGENRLKVIVTNKESEKSLRVTLDAGFKANHAIATCMENPSLTALAGTTIQRATVAPSGEFSPKRAYTLTVTEGRVNCYVPSMGAIVISIT